MLSISRFVYGWVLDLVYPTACEGRWTQVVKMTFWTSIASNILYPSTASDSGIILSNMNLARASVG